MAGAISIRYSDGQSEFHLSEKTPKVGDVLKRNGDNWVVVEVQPEKDGTSTVILRPGLKST